MLSQLTSCLKSKRRWAVIIPFCHGEIVLNGDKPKIINNPNVKVCIHYNAEATCSALTSYIHILIRSKIEQHNFLNDINPPMNDINCLKFKDYIEATDFQQLQEPQSSWHVNTVSTNPEITKEKRDFNDVNKIGLWNKNSNIYVEKLFSIAQDHQIKYGWQTGIYIGNNNIGYAPGKLVDLMSPENPTITVSQIIKRLCLTELYMKDFTCSALMDNSLTPENIQHIEEMVNETLITHNPLDIARSISSKTTAIDDSVIPEYVKLQEEDGTVYWYSTIHNTKIYRKPTTDDTKILIPVWTLTQQDGTPYWYTSYGKLNKNHEIEQKQIATLINPYLNKDKLKDLTTGQILTPMYIELVAIDGNKYWYNRLNGQSSYIKPTTTDDDIFIPKWVQLTDGNWKTQYFKFKSVKDENYEMIPEVRIAPVNHYKLEGETEESEHIEESKLKDELEGELKELDGGNKKAKCKKTKCKKTKCKKTKCKKISCKNTKSKKTKCKKI